MRYNPATCLFTHIYLNFEDCAQFPYILRHFLSKLAGCLQSRMNPYSQNFMY